LTSTLLTGPTLYTSYPRWTAWTYLVFDQSTWLLFSPRVPLKPSTRCKCTVQMQIIHSTPRRQKTVQTRSSDGLTTGTAHAVTTKLCSCAIETPPTDQDGQQVKLSKTTHRIKFLFPTSLEVRLPDGDQSMEKRSVPPQRVVHAEEEIMERQIKSNPSGQIQSLPRTDSKSLMVLTPQRHAWLWKSASRNQDVGRPGMTV